MSSLGGFSEEALQLFQLAASERAYEFSEDGEVYDFTRCMRPNGTFYGTRGKCKSGSDAGAKAPVKPATPKGKKISEAATRHNTNKALGEMQRAAMSAGKKAQAPKKPRASSSQLKESQAKLYDDAKAKRAAAKEAEKAARQVMKETKGDKSKEARQRRQEADKAWERAAAAADRAQNAWMKEHTRWSRAAGRDERAKMSPAQRAEARRVDKIIKERG